MLVPVTMLVAVSMILFCFPPSHSWFMAACIAWSVALSAGAAGPTAYAADSAPPGMNAVAMSTFRMTADAGYVIGPIVLGLVADAYGPVAALLGAAAVLVAVALTFAVVAPETHRPRAS